MATIGTKMPATAASQKSSCPVTVAAAASATPTTKSSAAKAKKSRTKQQKKSHMPAPAVPKPDPLALAVSQDLLIRLQISSKSDGETSTGAVAPATNGTYEREAAGCSSTAATTTASAAVSVPAAGTCTVAGADPASTVALTPNVITYVIYENELQMPDIMRLIQKDLSEPYSIYTYRYFIHNWPKLCYLAMHGEKCIGAIVCKLDIHRQSIKRGYIAMLAVDQDYRKLKIGTQLVQNAIHVSDRLNRVDYGWIAFTFAISQIPSLRYLVKR